MNNINIVSFEQKLQDYIQEVINNHRPLKVNNNGQDFIVISVQDYEREQETLSILQNNDLMKQIAQSMETHVKHQGYCPTNEEINEIFNI